MQTNIQTEIFSERINIGREVQIAKRLDFNRKHLQRAFSAKLTPALIILRGISNLTEIRKNETRL